MRSCPVLVALLVVVVASIEAFTLHPRATTSTVSTKAHTTAPRFRMSDQDNDTNTNAAATSAAATDNGDDDDDDDVPLEAVESLGRGAAKAKRGKRKGSSVESKAAAVPKRNLAPEETFYEGPPAISETILPTVSILTVIGIIPAAAAWARQAWVRYRITDRRIRVTSGFGGNEMAEIVYPDIVEIRTAKRLFGDGDMVAFLRDGAKFEMRNIPNFEETMDFILNQVDKDVAAQYRNKGEVTQQ